VTVTVSRRAGAHARDVTLQCGTAVADLLGVPAKGLRRRPPLRVMGKWTVGVVATATPWGDYDCGLAVDGRGIVVPYACDEPDMAVTAPYDEVVLWLHGEWLLGDLIRRGRAVRGDVFVWSATSGVISAPSTDGSDVRRIRDHLVAFATGRAAGC
jgi:hypothetical protein